MVCEAFDPIGEMLAHLLLNLKVGKIDKLNPMNYDWEEQQIGVLR